jgi:hypothetical protein
MNLKLGIAGSLIAVGSIVAAGCANGGNNPGDGEDLAVDCKCDSPTEGAARFLRSHWRSLDEVDSGDLVNLAAGFATESLNDQLAGGGAIARIDPPELYALPERAARDLTLRNIETLSHGLTARYGDGELSALVNRARRAHLGRGPDTVFAESAFQIGASAARDWSYPIQGIGAGDGSLSFGFSAGGTVEARVVVAGPTELRATGASMLAAVREMRGFVLPRSVEDLLAMDPGESFALSGQGWLGMNVGAGLPILVRSPVPHLTYNIVISAALRARIQGQLDVQLARLDNEEVVVDVGASNVRERYTELAIRDGWGVSGFSARNIELAGRTVDLTAPVTRALQRRLDAQLNLIDGRVSDERRNSRVSVARFRFRLEELDEAGREALEQALKADLRLAQLLAGQGHPGVIAEVDMVRAGRTATSHAGIEILGMRFFRETLASSGSTVIQTPGAARVLMFDSLHRESGYFFTTNRHTRVALSGLVFDPSGSDSDANLILQLAEGDEWMQREKIIDHLDPVIHALAGAEAFRALERSGNEIERRVGLACQGVESSSCPADALALPVVQELRATAIAEFTAQLGHLSPEQRQMALAAANLRIAAQSVFEPNVALVGPPASAVFSLRLDDAGLNQLMSRTGSDFGAALQTYLSLTQIDRAVTAEDLSRARARLRDAEAGDIARLAEMFETARRNYAVVTSMEGSDVERLGELGVTALDLRIPVDRNSAPLYQEATLQSIAQARAEIARNLFDELVAAARSIPGRPERAVIYSLLAMIPQELHDTRLDIRMRLGGSDQPWDVYRGAGYAPLDIYAHGPGITPINGGTFNLEALTRVD